MPRPPRPAAKGRAALALTPLEDRTNPVSFGTPDVYLGVGANHRDVAVGDLTGDGAPDLVVAGNLGGILALINDGSGGFTFAGPVVSVGDPRGVALADVNADGKLDVVAATGGNKSFALAFGNGDGTFGPPAFVDVGANANGVVVADFNRDGRPDVAVASNGFRVFLHDGTATPYALFTAYGDGDQFDTVAAGDFDADGDTDLAAAGFGADPGPVTVVLNAGSGTFGSSIPYPHGVGTGVVDLAAADLNGDGRDDLAVAYAAENRVGVALATPAGAFPTASLYPTPILGPGQNLSVAVADFDLDGFRDVAVGLLNEGRIAVLLNDGTGVLSAPVSANGGTTTPDPFVAVGDVNGDGRPDLVAASGGSGGQVTVIPNTTPLVASFDVVAVPSAVAGQAFDATVTARDDMGNVITDYAGVVTFDSPDLQVSPGDGLPLDYKFTPADAGTHTFTGVVLRTVIDPSSSITVRDRVRLGASGTAPIAVTPAAAVRFAVNGPTGPVTAGTPASFTVTALDPFGNVDTNYAGTVRASSSDPLADLPANFTLTAGTATVPVTLKTAGTQSVTFVDTVDGTINGTFPNITVTPAAPAAVAAVDGAGQSAVVNTDFPIPLRARVTDAFGNPVSGVTVTFTAPGSGASATFPLGNTAVTDANGEAAVRARANGTAGGYAVTASAAGATPATFNLGNTAGAVAGLLAVGGSGQTAPVDTPFLDPLVVRVVDAFGNPVEGAAVTFRGPASGPGIAPAVGTATSDAAGLAQFTPTANTVAGDYTITAEVISGGVTVTVGFGATNTPGPAAGVELVSGGGQEVAVGTPFDNPVVVRVVDEFGNGVPGVTVTFAAVAGPGGASAVFPDGPTAVTDIDGLATFLVEANTVAGSYTVTATAAGVGGSVSVPLTNLPGAVAAVVAAGGGGQVGTVNSPFPLPLRAKAVDAFGNGVPGIAVRFTGPTSGAGVLFPGGDVIVTGADGIAEAPIRANVTAGSYTVTAAAEGVFGEATFNLTNAPGEAAVVRAVSGDGATTQVGTDFAVPIRVRVEDAFGNGVSGVTVTFTAPADGPSATFPGGNTAVTDAAGLAAVSARANTIAGSYTVTATAPGAVAAGSVGLTNLAGAPVAFRDVTGGGQSATVNTAFAEPLAVTVIDEFGNGVPGVTVRFAGPTTGPGVAFLSGPATEIVTDATGRAEASPGANIVAGSYTVTATVAGGRGGAITVSFALTNLAGPVFSVDAASGAGQSAEVTTDYAAPLVARVTDVFGNPVPGVVVTFESPAAGAGVTFPGGTTATTGADGTAAVSVRANTVSGPFAVLARAAGLGQPVSFLLTNTAGAAVGVAAVSGGGQSTGVGTEFLDPLVVAATDRFGNPVPGVAVSVAAPGSGASATFPGGTTATTGPDGTASFTAAANTVAGSYTVTATAPGLPGASATFALTNTAATPTTLTIQGGDAQATAAGTGFGQPLAVLVQDQFGNPVPGAEVVFSAPITGATVGFPSGNVAPTGADGFVRLPVTAGTVAGVYPVQALTTGVEPAAFTLTNLAAAPAAVVVVSGAGQSAETNAPFAQPIVVEVRDAFGNPVPGATVLFAGPAGGPGASLNPASQTTGPDGRASFAATAGNVAGAVSADFRVAGLEGVLTVPLTVTAPPTGLVGVDTTAVGAGPGQVSPVRVLNPDGSTKTTLNPFPGFTGGVRVAAGDFNNDGTADIATGTGPGAALVVVYDGVTNRELFRVQPFEAGFSGGVFVSAGDLDGDGAAELVVSPDVGGGPRVVVFRGRDFARVADFFGITGDPNFRGGVRTAAGDFNRDGKADLVVAAGASGGPRVAVFDGSSVMTSGGLPAKLFNDVFVFESRLRDGVYVSAGDVDGDGQAELVAGGGPGGGPRVLVLSGADLLDGDGPPRFVANFFAGSLEDRNGVRVSVKDLDGDDRADLVVGAADRVIAYYGDTVSSTGAPPEAFSLDATLGVFVG
ncbi:MAG: Ig-like domain-containing protein [Gemmataceae bacterium]|nr:Ig-like domain-containing protein [Gemmataceae bacterium]